jgi:pyruvate formate lyase activating enzyme
VSCRQRLKSGSAAEFVIGMLQKTSLLDYPGKISAIIFTQGCNFRCGYCHNPELITSNAPAILVPECLGFLKTRRGKLDGVVITGGEPCLQRGLKDFLRSVKSLGFLVKLDTNGAFPEVVGDLLNENLIDYIAMDIKAPLEKYRQITGIHINTEKIMRSIRLIINSGVDYEFRTTAVSSQLTPQNFEQIARLIKGAKKYYLQKFIPAKTLDKRFMNEKSYSDEEFTEIIKSLKDIDIVEAR